ncbi:MAG: peptidoglycan-associated lipoprotein Pal [Nitrospirae bacterium]|nr:peptidoglycan-associated lipoprotein Pal [Nitrospirota bacterium]
MVFGMMFFACAQRRTVQLPPTIPQETKAPEARPEKKVPEEKITEEQVAKIESREVEVPKYAEEKGIFEDIHFDFDKYDIRVDAKPILESVADWLIKNKTVLLLIEGHCDERGTNEYNLALGDRRAKATKDYLIALGIPSGRIQIMSYGEEKPLCIEKTEDCWQKNRRSHFVTLKEKGK